PICRYRTSTPAFARAGSAPRWPRPRPSCQKNARGAVQQLLLPIIDRVRMNPKLTGQLGDRSVAFDRRQRHLRLERRVVLLPCPLHVLLLPHRRFLGAGLHLSYCLIFWVHLAVAGLKELAELRHAGLDAHGWLVLAVGLVIGSLSAFVAIGGLLRILERFSAWPFAVYRAFIGAVLLAGVATGGVGADTGEGPTN